MEEHASQTAMLAEVNQRVLDAALDSVRGVGKS